jgi:NADPH:quinone reductase-like Zn-dependent oxidoreductase
MSFCGDNAAMRAAGIRALGGQIEELELPDPPDLTGDEVLIEVRAAGIGNWDDLVRTGAWDVGATPPMALGVEAAGVVRAVGATHARFAPGNEVLVHSVPLPNQGTWAEWFLAPGGHVAAKPSDLDWAVAAALPVPALTASQVITSIGCGSNDDALIHGAGGVTGGLLVALAAASGCHVVATCSPRAAGRVRNYGASEVVDYHAADWPSQALRANRRRFSVVINAVRGDAAALLPLVADRGRLATITGDPPSTERGIQVVDAYVAPDGPVLEATVGQLIARGLTIPIAGIYGLGDAAVGLQTIVQGHAEGACVLDPTRTRNRAANGVSSRAGAVRPVPPPAKPNAAWSHGRQARGRQPA